MVILDYDFNFELAILFIKNKLYTSIEITNFRVSNLTFHSVDGNTSITMRKSTEICFYSEFLLNEYDL